jgi:hypothetical protein
MISVSSRRRHLLVAAGFLCCSLSLATSVEAEPRPDDRTRAAARQLAQDGAAAFERGEFEKARALLRRASTLYPAPTITLMEARALEKLGRFVEAAERYEDARRTTMTSESSSAYSDAIAAADQELEKLRPKIPLLTIVVQNSGQALDTVEVRLDGRTVPVALIGVRQPVDPGAHRIVVKKGDKVITEHAFSLKEGQSELITLDASGQIEVQEDAGSPWPWIAFGIGGAGVATGIAAGLVMLDKQSSLDDACTPQCPESSQDDLDGFRTARTVSFVGYGVGLVGVGLGTVLLLTRLSSDHQAHLTPTLGLGQVGLRGRF